jgi:DNA end-binding protein Ku
MIGAEMRSVRNSGLTFGLVNIAVKMFVASESHDTKFHQHHAKCLGATNTGAISMPRVCKDCGEKVDSKDIVKGVTVDDKLVTVDSDEIKALDEEQDPSIEVVQFVHADEIDPILFESTHYLDADKGSEKGYAMLRQVLEESRKVGIVRYSMRGRTRMGVLRVYGNALAIHALLWHDEVRSTDELLGAAKQVKLTPKEVKMAHVLVESMSGEWNPAEYVDTYAQRMTQFIETKSEGGEFVPVVRASDKQDVSDLLAALENSIARHPAGKKRVAIAS